MYKFKIYMQFMLTLSRITMTGIILVQSLVFKYVSKVKSKTYILYKGFFFKMLLS